MEDEDSMSINVNIVDEKKDGRNESRCEIRNEKNERRNNETKPTLLRNMTNKNFRKELKTKIIDDIVKPAYINDAEEILMSRITWRQWEKRIKFVTPWIKLLAITLAFSVGFFDMPWFGFLSGFFQAGHDALIMVINSSKKEFRFENRELNILLKDLEIDEININRENEHSV